MPFLRPPSLAAAAVLGLVPALRAQQPVTTPQDTTTLGDSSVARLARGVELGVDARYTGSQWLRGDEANVTTPLGGYTIADARVGYGFGAWELQALVTNLFDRGYATFGTFNLNQSNGHQLERVLTPGMPRILRIVLRRGFGG